MLARFIFVLGIFALLIGEYQTWSSRIDLPRIPNVWGEVAVATGLPLGGALVTLGCLMLVHGVKLRHHIRFSLESKRDRVSDDV